MSSTLGGKLGLTSSSTWDNVVTAITNATVSTVLSFSLASTAYNSITFTWKNPASGGFAGVVIVGKTGSYPTSPTDGTVYYAGTGNNTAASGTSSTTLTSFSGSTTYYFRCWSYVLINNTKWYSDSYKEANITTAVNKGQQIFTASGTFTVPTGVTSIDIFCVGGGGTGHRASSTATSKAGGGGGGSGYTATKLKQAVTPGTEYTITIGAGGTNDGPTSSNKQTGNTTSFDTILSAEGGYTYTSTRNGGNGGSAGGNGYDAAGGITAGLSDGGSHNVSSGSIYGLGQGTTTRAFGESSNTLYAGGGGGGGCDWYNDDDIIFDGGAGGAGGGGDGGRYKSNIAAKSGTANTGGGGGGGYYVGKYNYVGCYEGASGGSGICIVRWGY